MKPRTLLSLLCLLLTTCDDRNSRPIEVLTRADRGGARSFEVTIRTPVDPDSLQVELNGTALAPADWKVELEGGAGRVSGPLPAQVLRTGDNSVRATARTRFAGAISAETTFVHAPAGAPPAGRLKGHVDWQGHPAMHLCWPFFKPGLTEVTDPDLTWKHQFRQSCHAPDLRASGIRVFGAAAMAAERAENPAQARKLILDQLAYVERFVSENSADFALARTPEEARWLLANTARIVVVHQIEGGRMILSGPEDARFWADQGVMLITLIHLLDDELGGSALEETFVSGAINLKGWARRRSGARRGLTTRGKEAIVELAREGILVDLTHMSPDSVDDALAVCQANGIPPVVTHGMFSPIKSGERSFTPEQVLAIHRLGGAFSIPVNGGALDPAHPTVPIPATLVPGTMSSFRFHYEFLQGWLFDHAALALEDPSIQSPADLTEEQKTRLAVGWASDWNGWTDHTRPDPPGTVPAGTPPLAIDRIGLAHPGLLPQYWQRLAESGMDLEPLERSVEQFLRVWERARLGPK